METGYGSLHTHRTGPHRGSRPTETVPVGWPPFRGGEACYHLTTPRTSTGPISCNQTHTCTFNTTTDDSHSAALTTPGRQEGLTRACKPPPCPGTEPPGHHSPKPEPETPQNAAKGPRMDPTQPDSTHRLLHGGGHLGGLHHSPFAERRDTAAGKAS